MLKWELLQVQSMKEHYMMPMRLSNGPNSTFPLCVTFFIVTKIHAHRDTHIYICTSMFLIVYVYTYIF